MKKMFLLTLILFSLQGNALVSDFHGYLRAGTGSNLLGGKQECYNNAQSSGNEFRLGNECEIYGELTMSFDLTPQEIKDEIRAKLYMTYAFTAENKKDWEAGTNQWVPRQIYAEIEEFKGKSYSLWLGKRFFRWGDLYLSDFYPMNFSGPGVGISDIKTSMGKMQLALIQNTDAKEFESGTAVTGTPLKDAAKTTLHWRWENIPTSKETQSDFWLILGNTASTQTNTQNYKATTGIAVAGKTSFSALSGKNELGLAAGLGSLSNLSASGELVRDCADTTNYYCTVEASSRWRLWGSHFKENETYGLQVGAIYDSYNKSTLRNSQTDWLSFGVQPVYFITDRIHLGAVLGFSQVENQSDSLGIRQLWRFTVAPQWAPKRSFWARPALRVYYTYTGWNNENVSSFSSKSTAGHNQSHAIGAQTEVWF